MIRKITVLFAVLLLSSGAALRAAAPDEGMWLPLLLKQLNIGRMQQLGCKLSAEDIYNVNQACLKDAIVELGNFCSGEVVSDQGLVLTNHHCGYDAIATHSSPEHDYLTDGFWAKSKSEELHTPGLTMSFLVRMEDVTERINTAVAAVPAADRDAKIGEEMEKIITEATDGTHYNADVESMMGGNNFYLFVYERFTDIRLVGAPPSSVGKFGGDTDNWMWPRHTGDFSMFRIYAGKDNKPADYSADNVPLKPRHSLPISLKGVKENDFAMIMGYPGSTDRYFTSYDVDQAYKYDNNDYVRLFDTQLKVMKAEMDKDPAIRIALASDYASKANTWKYFLGQNNGLKTRGLVEEKQAFENKFMDWVNADNSRRQKYGEVLNTIRKNVENSRSARKLSHYLGIAGFGPGAVVYGIGWFRLYNTMKKDETKKEAWSPLADNLKEGLEDHFATFYAGVDQKVFAAMVRHLFEDLPADQHMTIFTDKTFTKFKNKPGMDRFDQYAAYVYSSSVIANKAKAKAWLDKPSLKTLDADPGVKYVLSLIDKYRAVQGSMAGINMERDETFRLWMAGVREMNPDKAMYPDANSTLRLTYGQIMPYNPRDGVAYKYQTTANGILEKEIPGDEEFDVPQRLHDLLEKKEFGRYGKNGELYTCFLSNTDITGGNSGSPVMNAEGHLIGIAFDGNWESMTSDLVFDPGTVRTISVDIRYVLFIIDKYAGAKHLVDEMKIVE